jgi:hypothetical protein
MRESKKISAGLRLNHSVQILCRRSTRSLLNHYPISETFMDRSTRAQDFVRRGARRLSGLRCLVGVGAQISEAGIDHNRDQFGYSNYLN